jgi:hypothetical protein
LGGDLLFSSLLFSSLFQARAGYAQVTRDLRVGYASVAPRCAEVLTPPQWRVYPWEVATQVILAKVRDEERAAVEAALRPDETLSLAASRGFARLARDRGLTYPERPDAGVGGTPATSGASNVGLRVDEAQLKVIDALADGAPRSRAIRAALAAFCRSRRSRWPRSSAKRIELGGTIRAAGKA